MRKYTLPAVVGMILLVLAGCATPTVDISIKVPGELNLKNISKIAVVEFNTLDINESKEHKPASKALLRMATSCARSVFYDNPFYKLTDLDVEREILKSNNAAKLSKRLDAIIYGRLWWQESNEYRNTYPKVFTLKSWRVEKYNAGKDSTGKDITSSVTLTTHTKDVLEDISYRGKSYSLILELTIYSVRKNGALTKETRFFEIASDKEIMDNGRFSSKSRTLNAKTVGGKLSAMKSANSGKSFTLNKKEEARDVTGAMKLTQHKNTLPPPELVANNLMRKIVKGLTDKIAPHREIITVAIGDSDVKTTELVKNKAFKAAKHHLVKNVLSGKNNNAYESFYDLDFDQGLNVLACAQAKKDEDKADNDYIADFKEDFVDDNFSAILNYAICEEALGRFERALYIYRYLFNAIPDKNTAQGVSRCLFALDMADKVKEKNKNKRKAEKKQSLR